MEFNDLVLLGPKRILEGPKYREAFHLSISDPNENDQGFAQDATISSDGGIPGSDSATPAGGNMTPEAALEAALIARLVDENSPDPTDIQQRDGGRAPRRPSNAFILYRKDKQAIVKRAYPRIANNEICKFLSKFLEFYANHFPAIFVAALWKNESENVRQCYHTASNQVREKFLTLHPGYRYNPRRSNEIPRRAKRVDHRTRTRTRTRTRARTGTAVEDTNPFAGNVDPLANIEPRDVRTATPEDLRSGRIRVGPPSPNGFPGASSRPVGHSLSPDHQEVIRARFPGTTYVVRGPVQTTLVAELPHAPTPMITAVIRNEDMDAMFAAAKQNGEASVVQGHSVSDQLVFPVAADPFITPQNNRG